MCGVLCVLYLHVVFAPYAQPPTMPYSFKAFAVFSYFSGFFFALFPFDINHDDDDDYDDDGNDTRINKKKELQMHAR